MTVRNLTSYESSALRGPINLSDGHPRQRPTSQQADVLDRLGSTFVTTWQQPFAVTEARAQQRFFAALGQRSDLIDKGRVLSCYSSSVAMDIFARALRERTTQIALIHPTFDNIPDLLRAWGHTPHPVAEEDLEACRPSVFDHDVGCVFVVMPNNPTGWVMPPKTMDWLARQCRSRGVILALDASFRGFDHRAWYDSYKILDQSGAEYVVIEDSGKLWPAQELKIGFLACGTERIPLYDAFSDLLLTVSPVVLALVGELAVDAADGGFARLHSLIEHNRRLVRELLAEREVSPVDLDSRVSVERVRLPPGIDAQEVYAASAREGVHVLPCGPFHWARPSEGSSSVRISLARDTDLLRHGVQRLLSTLPASRERSVSLA